MIVPATVSRPPQIVISGPLVEIRDSMIDRPMVDVITREVRRILQNVLVEPSSSSGLTTHKRIRSS
jgi:hypothetical protein